jgi:hypothetical protein
MLLNTQQNAKLASTFSVPFGLRGSEQEEQRQQNTFASLVLQTEGSCLVGKQIDEESILCEIVSSLKVS